eukprot:TRINITY_DN477_c0_g2_i1.p1 TRINITY_DN477_c0_g2~~TRINITY_DN477_c0_g2_i1.p1  ORF type:complete len:1671 (+),score=364.81 TRINITY_DN477_c0_g2_i1:51-5063(+)
MFSQSSEYGGGESSATKPAWRDELTYDLVQLRLMMWKNWLLKKRRLMSTLAELFVPALLMVVIVLGWSAAGSDKYDASIWSQYQDPAPSIEDFLSYLSFSKSVDERYHLAFAPQSPEIDAFLNYASRFPNFNATIDGCNGGINNKCYFKTEKELSDYALNQDSEPDELYMGIIFKEFTPTRWTYLIRMNSSDIPTSDILYDELNVVPVAWIDDTESEERNIDDYLTNGYITMQNFINRYVFLTYVTSTDKEFVPEFAPYPTPEYQRTAFFDALQGIMGFFIALAFIWPVSRLVKNIVEEKEYRIKEGMKMMGLKGWVFNASWFLTYLIIFFISSFLIFLLLGPTIFQHCDQALVFWVIFLFSMSVLMFCFMLSTLFNKAKVSATVAPLLFLIAAMPPNAFDSEGQAGAKALTSIFLSPTAFTFALNEFVKFESAEKGVTFDNMYDGDFSFGAALWCIIASIIIYSILTWYLEKVVPREYGTNLPWFFPFTREYWTKTQKSAAKAPLLQGNQVPMSSVEGVSPEMENKVSIQIASLRKVYETTEQPKVAVDNLSLTMYEGQITALLGHNGAGKSTTISMLTGLYPPTDGDAFLNGKSIVADMTTIRRDLGVCPQHDILFDILTVYEHLCLYAGLKGVPKNKIDSEVRKKIEEVGLVDKTNTYSMALSGGMKRKLSVAIALIGDSKIVILDEPTSGMDPYSRRATWKLLQDNKAGRTMILTTHFMDEADLLGDRIAIMSSGQLRCCGSSLFLKAKYGVGYNMTLVKDEKYDHEKTSSYIRSCVPQAAMISNVGAEVVFQLPMSSVERFPDMLEMIESQSALFGVRSYGISVTTLEEVFMRLAHNDHEDDETRKADAKKKKEIMQRRMSVSSTSKSQIAPMEMTSDGKTSAAAIQSNLFVFGNHFKAMFMKRYRVGSRDKRSILCQLFLPVVVIIVGMALLSINYNTEQALLVLEENVFQDPYEMFYNDGTAQKLFIETYMDAEIKDSLVPLTIDSTDPANNLSQYILSTYDVYAPTSRPGSFIIDETDFSAVDKYRYLILHNQTQFHTVPALNNYMVNAIARSLGGNVKVTSQVRAFPLTEREQDLIDGILAIIASFFVLIAYCILSSQFAVFIVKEKETKAKHLQFVSGVNIFSYWLASYLWDLLSYTAAVTLTLIVFAAFGRDEFVGDSETAGATFILFFLYGVAVIPYTYCLSFFFTNHSSAQNVLLMANFLLGFVTVQANFILDAISSTQDINKSLKYIYRLFPPFCLGEGIIQLSSVDLCKLGNDADECAPFNTDIAGQDMAWLTGHAVFFTVLFFFLDSNQHIVSKILDQFAVIPPYDPTINNDDDEDVKTERERIENGLSHDMITIRNLRKVYGTRGNAAPKVAVHDTSIGIPMGECFGLLGINGAGKTTTLSILTGDFLPTSGTAVLNNLDILTHMPEIRSILGYCPQFDAILELMTGREHLEMYARLRGIPEHKISQVVESSIQKLDLEQFAGKAAGSYSGGNKRKLSVAIALIGDPKIVFLDEPSTGMDPVARRFMWDIISSTMAGRCVILTTHSMEECEALCSRIGIMVGGRMRCLGSAQHLKSRFGTGYQIDISSELESVEEVKSFVTSTFPGAQLLEWHAGTVKYDVPRQKLTLSNMFRTIQANRERLHIINYAISQTTLEQIFISKARSNDFSQDHVE